MSKQLLGFDPRLRAAVKQHVSVFNPGAATGDATEEWLLLAAAYDLVIHRVSWVPKTDVTGAATNTFHLNVFNRLANDTGTAELGNVDFVSGTNAADEVETVIVSTAKAVKAGNVITVQRELVGTGLAMPEGAFSAVFTILDRA